MLSYNKILTTPFIVVLTKELGITLPLPTIILLYYPLFIKPAAEGLSKGINYFNKVDKLEHLGLVVWKLRSKFPN
jgi:hypothetical protein